MIMESMMTLAILLEGPNMLDLSWEDPMCIHIHAEQKLVTRIVTMDQKVTVTPIFALR